MAAKSPFCLPSILLPEAMDKSGTPLRLMLRPPSFYQCPICQVLSSGLDGTWRQPKGVECGISKIPNYNSSWILLALRAHEAWGEVVVSNGVQGEGGLLGSSLAQERQTMFQNFSLKMILCEAIYKASARKF